MCVSVFTPPTRIHTLLFLPVLFNVRNLEIGLKGNRACKKSHHLASHIGYFERHSAIIVLVFVVVLLLLPVAGRVVDTCEASYIHRQLFVLLWIKKEQIRKMNGLQSTPSYRPPADIVNNYTHLIIVIHQLGSQHLTSY